MGDNSIVSPGVRGPVDRLTRFGAACSKTIPSKAIDDKHLGRLGSVAHTLICVSACLISSRTSHDQHQCWDTPRDQSSRSTGGG